MSATRAFAIITGASAGIGFELAKRCADAFRIRLLIFSRSRVRPFSVLTGQSTGGHHEGYDLLIAADKPPSSPL